MRRSDLWQAIGESKALEKAPTARKWAFLTILGIAIGSTLVALGGVISAKISNRCLLSLYSLGIFVSCATSFIAGGLLLGADYTSGKALDKFCSN